MCDYHLGTNGYPQDFECVNGVAIDIDCYIEGAWDDCLPAPCHPYYCKACRGTGEVEEDGGAADCEECDGTGYTNGKDDSIDRLTEHSQQDETEIPEACEVCGEIVLVHILLWAQLVLAMSYITLGCPGRVKIQNSLIFLLTHPSPRRNVAYRNKPSKELIK